MPEPVNTAAKGGGADHGTTTGLSMLSMEGVERLWRDPSACHRIETAHSVGAAFANGQFSASEQAIAEAILESLSRDGELKVRQSVCEQVLHCTFIPPQIVRILAQDVDSVAVPIIRCSQALSEDDLIAVVRHGNTLKQVGVARRETVAPPVSHELVVTGKKTVVKTVLSNEGADIWEDSLHEIVDTFGDVGSVQSLLVERPVLPATVTQRLVPVVSAAYAERLLQRHGPSPAQERQPPPVDGPIEAEASPLDIEAIARTVDRPETLTPTFVLRALCVGNMNLFVALMSSLARVSRANTRTLINDPGQDGFRALYFRSGLPEELFAAFRIALDIALEAERAEQAGWHAATTRRIIRELARNYDEVSSESLDSTLRQLADRLPEDQRILTSANWIG
jgi:uncharacterized protein (DUF2336 family)